MKKQMYVSWGTKNAFLMPLLVVMLLILGVVMYAASKKTELRSKAGNESVCTIARREFGGVLTCPSGSTLRGNRCCSMPETTSRPVCNKGVSSLCLNTPCEGGYRHATVTCLDGFSQKSGDESSCKTPEKWSSYAVDICRNLPNCLTPTAKITPPPTSPRPPSPTPRIPVTSSRPIPTSTPAQCLTVSDPCNPQSCDYDLSRCY